MRSESAFSVVSLLGICFLFGVTVQIWMLVNRLVDEDINVALSGVTESSVRNDVLATYVNGGVRVQVTPFAASTLLEIANNCKIMTDNKREFIAFIVSDNSMLLSKSTDGNDYLSTTPAIGAPSNCVLGVCALDKGSHNITNPSQQCTFAQINPAAPTGPQAGLDSILLAGVAAELGESVGVVPTAGTVTTGVTTLEGEEHPAPTTNEPPSNGGNIIMTDSSPGVGNTLAGLEEEK